eukprot:TRINITY_DN2745_c0_g1_i4.p1 TRINITY_DN2745_c0_g1~~TRINITY_DN2745_c0_g1_i4.p1  ORF type:complete len:305 (-),score=33.89 TRINITY_DN2745_c0_g1_i4:529-1443(-)
MNYFWVVGLSDLKTEDPWVQKRLADYIVDLMGIGFSGFRIDAGKHVHPADQARIFGEFKRLLGEIPSDFLVYNEMTYDCHFEKVFCYPSEYSFHHNMTVILKEEGWEDHEIHMLKFWVQDYDGYSKACKGVNKLPMTRVLVQNECHDHQNTYGGSIPIIAVDKNPCKYQRVVAELMRTSQYESEIKLLMTSYWVTNGYKGFPDGKSDCGLCRNDICKKYCTNSVPKKDAADPNACPYEGMDGFGYTRVHRDLAIVRAMREWLGISTQIEMKDIGLRDECEVKCSGIKLFISFAFAFILAVASFI